MPTCEISAAAHHHQRGALGHVQAPLVLLLGRRKRRHALQGAGSKNFSASAMSRDPDHHGVLEAQWNLHTDLQLLLYTAHRDAELLAEPRQAPQRTADLQESGDAACQTAAHALLPDPDKALSYGRGWRCVASTDSV
jgi:hypothetical protein